MRRETGFGPPRRLPTRHHGSELSESGLIRIQPAPVLTSFMTVIESSSLGNCRSQNLRNDDLSPLIYVGRSTAHGSVHTCA